MFLYSSKGIELYICLFGNASKMRGEVKPAITGDSHVPFRLCFSTVKLLDTRSVEVHP